MPEHEPKKHAAPSASPDAMLPDINAHAEPYDLPAAPDAETGLKVNKHTHKSASAFRPSKRQVAYLQAWLDPQAPKTISGIARHIDVPRRTVSHWLAQDQFMTWFNAELERETDHLWRPLLLKTANLAMQGSVEHAKLLALIRGAIRQDDGPQRGGVTVIVGVPRSGDPTPLPPADPRPMLPPAPSSEEH